MDRLILETTFLVDLEREAAGKLRGQATRFLEERRSGSFYITFTIAGELAAGASMQEREVWERFVAPFHVLPSTAEVAWQYGRVYQHLKDNGVLIGGNDIWIAASALANQMPLVTRNVSHFRRVPGIEVLDYAT